MKYLLTHIIIFLISYYFCYLNIPYFIIFIISLLKESIKYYFYKKKTKKCKNKKQETFFNILVCAKNEEDRIVRCLESLTNINYPSELYHITIINDHSTDNTVSNSINFLKNKKWKNYRIINRERKNGFVAGVLNDGIISYDLSKKSFFGIIDADCLVSTEILNRVNSEIISNRLDALGVKEWHLTSNNPINSSQHLLCVYENYNNTSNFKVGHFFSNSVAKKIKYDEKSILEDKLFSEECMINNYKIKIIDDVLLFRNFSSNIKKIYSQQYRYQLGGIYNDTKNSKIINTMLIPLLLLFTIIIDYKQFLKIIIYIIIEVYSGIFIYYHNYYMMALLNSPIELKNLIKSQYRDNSLINLLSTFIFLFFVIFLRLVPFYRTILGIEKIKWNRF